MNKITPAKVTWKDGVPYSFLFEDYYFSTDGGLQETQYVFLKNNNLPGRWNQKPNFVIAETGFGTGLNFLATLHAWKTFQSGSKHLVYFSIEKFPMHYNDLKVALSLWPELQQDGDALLQIYPPLTTGRHHLKFDNNQCELVLLWGEVADQLKQITRPVDVWYLDGFAPSKNPEMWSSSLFQQIGQLTARDGTFSTYTAAGRVLRGLESVGFDIQKVSGFGKKREMMCGSLKENRLA